MYDEGVAKNAPREGDAPTLADRQLELDRERTKRFPDLLTRKLTRMSASPLAFLRGAAPLFYEILKARPDLAQGPAGEGFIVGDLHLENFGAYRPDALKLDAPPASAGTKKTRPVVFDLNDFDDCVQGAWWLDLLRLSTSLLLGGRELGCNGIVALELTDKLLGAWLRATFEGTGPPEPPAPVASLIEQVQKRPRLELLDARTRLVEKNGKRQFIRGPRYVDLPKDIHELVPSAFEGYIASLAPEDVPTKGSLEIIDYALRIAGTGSLGGLRVAVLVKGKGGPDGAWIFDLKEQGSPSASVLIGEPTGMTPAQRVVTGFRACVAHVPRMLGTTTLGKLSMFGRRLAPQDDKLNLRRLKSQDLPALATYLGALLGNAHAKGAAKMPKKWSKDDLTTVREHAITLAGIHEAVYLALCDRMRRLLP